MRVVTPRVPDYNRFGETLNLDRAIFYRNADVGANKNKIEKLNYNGNSDRWPKT